MSLVHKGGAFRLFGLSVFNFLSGLNPADIIVDISEVPYPPVRDTLKQVRCHYSIMHLSRISELC